MSLNVISGIHQELFDQEFWRSIPGFPNYEISSLGRVRRTGRIKGARAGRILAQRFISGRGENLYACVDLWHNNKRRTRRVHRLVARTFLGEPVGDRDSVDHINADRECNAAWNLRWVTNLENQWHKWQNRANGEDPIADRDLADADIEDITSEEIEGPRFGPQDDDLPF